MQYLNHFLITVVVTIVVSACGGGTSTDESSTTSWSIIADAGKDKRVVTGTSVQVTGEDSVETGLNKSLAYQWSIEKKPDNSNAAPPAPENTVNPRFAPDVDGEYQLRLDVSVAGSNDKETSYVTIVADSKRGPTVDVDAGKDQFVASNSQVQINQSSNIEIQADVYYIWQVINSPSETIKNLIMQQVNSQTKGIFQPLSFQTDVQGDYQFKLIAEDENREVIIEDEIIVTVGNGNSIPVSNAGLDQSSQVSQTVLLHGSAYDADNDSLSFAWYFTFKPSNSTVTLVDSSDVSASFVPDVPGTYVVTLKVTDGKNNPNSKVVSNFDSVVITVSQVNTKPEVYLGPDLTNDLKVFTNGSVSLYGDQSYDVDAQPLTYNWRLIDKPSNSNAVIAVEHRTLQNSRFIPDIAGNYKVQLEISDGIDKSVAVLEVEVVEQSPASETEPPVTLASKDGGTYNSAQSITLFCSDGDGSGCASTYFTIDGTEPSTDSVQYSTSIAIAENTTLKYFSIDNTGNREAVKTQNYIIDLISPNQPPVANAGIDQTVSEQSVVTLSGSGEDGDGTILSYSWIQTAGPNVVLENENVATTRFSAPTVSGNVVLTFRLTVMDDKNVAATDSIDVVVTEKRNVKVVAATGMPAIGYPDGFVYYSVDEPSIGRTGHIAFAGIADTSVNSTESSSNAIWGGMPNDLRVIIKENDTIPGLPNNVLFERVPSSLSPIVTKTGHIGFWAKLKGAVNESNDNALLAMVDGAIQLILRAGSTAPGFPVGTAANVHSKLSTILFSDGGMMIYGFAEGFVPAIWFWDFSTIKLIAVADGADVFTLPEASPSVYGDCKYRILTPNVLGSWGINNNGTLMFIAELFPNENCPSATLLKWNDGTLSKVVDTKNAVPMMNGGVFFTISQADINDNDDVLFVSSIRQPSIAIAGSVWLAPDADSPQLIALSDELIPNDYNTKMSLFTPQFVFNNAQKAAVRVAEIATKQQSVLVGHARQVQPYTNLSEVGASQLSLIAQTGDIPPGYPNSSFFAGFETTLLMNNLGDTVFYTVISDAVENMGIGSIWQAKESGGLKELITTGTKVLVNGTEQVIERIFFRGGSINNGNSALYSDTGQLIFKAQLSAASEANVLVTPE